jgi:uncharacterized OB-fold protein
MSAATVTMSSEDDKRLFQAAGTEAAPANPALIGGRCRCGYLFFPMQRFGCEKCGRVGTELAEALLSGSGRLRAHAQVHLHARPSPKVPFTVLEIALDDGPLVRALLDRPTDAQLQNGDRMFSTIVRAMRSDGEVELLRFRRAEVG